MNERNRNKKQKINLNNRFHYKMRFDGIINRHYIQLDYLICNRKVLLELYSFLK